MNFWTENGTKILGWLTLAFASVQGLITINAFDGLLSDTTIRWMGIALVILTGGTGSATINRGHVNTAQIKVADAITTALNTPPPKQGGFARVGMLLTLLITALLVGCVSNPDGSRELSATGKIALQEVTAIALRRSIADSPRAQEKVANIRHVATRLQAATAVTSISELRLVVDAELDRLKLTAIDRADANSLMNVFQALLIERVGKDEIDAQALMTVNEFVSMIVAALPPS